MASLDAKINTTNYHKFKGLFYWESFYIIVNFLIPCASSHAILLMVIKRWLRWLKAMQRCIVCMLQSDLKLQ